jgi:hypothetical protein
MNKFSCKRFLNKDSYHSVAAISVNLSFENRVLSGEISISDCSRTIYLDLDIYAVKKGNKESSGYDFDTIEESFENSIFKAQTMATVCQELADKLKEIKPEYLGYLKTLEDEKTDE